MKAETLDQMQQMKDNLMSMMKGDMTLVSELNSVQLAIQAAISQACKTPEVIRMFASKNTGQLRQRLAGLQREKRLGKASEDVIVAQEVEILGALKKLGEQLSPEEESFLKNIQQKLTQNLKEFLLGLV